MILVERMVFHQRFMFPFYMGFAGNHIARPTCKSVKDLPDKEKVWVLLYASDGKEVTMIQTQEEASDR